MNLYAEVRCALCLEGTARLERRESPLRGKPETVFAGRQELFSSGRMRAPRPDGAEVKAIGRCRRHFEARTQQGPLIEIVVSRVARAVCQDETGEDAKPVVSVRLADIARSFRDIAQSQGVAAIVMLSAIGHPDVVLMPGRHSGGIRARHNPGRKVRFGERATDGPIAIGTGRSIHADICDTARQVVHREQPGGMVQRTRRQEVHLSRERRVGNEARRETRGRRHRSTNQVDRLEDGRLSARPAGRQHVVACELSQDAAPLVMNAPGRFTMITVLGGVNRLVLSLGRRRGLRNLYIVRHTAHASGQHHRSVRSAESYGQLGPLVRSEFDSPQGEAK